MQSVDYLIVGSGLTGGTIARLLADRGHEVLVLERRRHLGGNVHDSLHPSKIRVHTYGPHYFRCASPRIWEFVRRFARFHPYDAAVKTQIKGHYKTWPINESLFARYPNWEKNRPAGPATNFEEACLQKMPRPLYDAYVKGYTFKQWGLDPRQLGPALASRIRINPRHQNRLTPHYAHQGLPVGGYAQMMINLLAGIPCLSNIDYLKHASEFKARKALIFTGSIDEYFSFDAGRLGYRSQKRVHEYLDDTKWYQPCAQVNHPDSDIHQPVRTLEWKHLMTPAERKGIEGTVITQEFPYTPKRPEDFEYPVPLPRNAELYRHYQARAAAIPRLIVCGRLGAYRYFDMDQAIAHGTTIAKGLLTSAKSPSARVRPRA